MYLTIPAIIKDDKNGGTIVIYTGDEFIIQISPVSQERTAGETYWFVHRDGSDALRLISSGPGQKPDGLGTHRWRYKAIVEGKTATVVLHYKKKWNDNPIRTFKITVRVDPISKRKFPASTYVDGR